MKSFNIVFCLILGICVSQSADASEPGDAFSIQRVFRVDKQKNDAGRVFDFPGKRHSDKFYQKETLLAPEDVGEEYVINWNAKSSGNNLILRFEYIPLEETGVKIEEIQINVVQAGPQRTVIEHKGTPYREHGRIRVWRVSLLQGDVILATRKSSFWPSRLSQ